MAMYGKYFEYNGRSSKDFGVMIGSFSGFDENMPMGLSRDLERGEMTRYRSRPNHFGTIYNDTLSFDLKLVKDTCGGHNDLEFSRSEVREINAWLTSPQYPRLFHMTDFDNKPELYDEYVDYFGTFTEVESYAQETVMELDYTFVNDSQFGYSTEYHHTIVSTSTAPATYSINCTTDEREAYLNPVMIITPTESGDITISNKTDGGTIKITGALRYDTITMDSQKLTVYDVTKKLITFENLGIEDVGKIYWLRLVYGNNDIEVTGDAKVEIIYREPRKVGAY